MDCLEYAFNTSKGITNMHTTHIDGIDLNLLRQLDALLQNRSVTLAAAQLGIGQPAASRGLARLRKALNDPLLVRTVGRYRLTPRAEQLIPAVVAALQSVDHVFAPARFEPSTSSRCFRIATTDYGSLAVMNRAAPALLREAPSSRLDIVPWNASTLDDLADGNVDLALYADDPLPPTYAYRKLFVESFSCMYRKGHPVAQRARSGPMRSRLKALAGYPQAVIAYPAGREILYEDLFEQWEGPRERIALSLPYFLAAPWIVAESDLVLVVPARIAECLASLKVLESVPFPMRNMRFEYRMIWHERVHRDLAHSWLRSVVVQSIG